MFVKKGDTRLQAGMYDQYLQVFRMTSVPDGTGGFTRQKENTPAWESYANCNEYQGEEFEEGHKIVGKSWCLITLPWMGPDLIPIEGMVLVNIMTGQEWEVRSGNHVETGRKKIEVNARAVR